jgi:hypothetical protein
MKKNMCYYFVGINLMFITVTSCNSLPSDLSERKDNIEKRLDSLNNIEFDNSDYKNTTIIITLYNSVLDTFKSIANDCDKRKLKFKYDDQYKGIKKKLEGWEIVKQDLAKDRLYGTWEMTLTTGEVDNITINKNGRWSKAPIGGFGAIFGSWSGTPSYLTLKNDRGTLNLFAFMSKDGTALYVNFFGTQMTYTKK